MRKSPGPWTLERRAVQEAAYRRKPPTNSHLMDPAVRERSRETLRRRRDELFWTLTDRTSGCWEWTASRRSKDQYGRGNYGTLMRKGRSLYAHRVAYELTYGPIPEGMFVLHSCDNPPCINPAHLSVGTSAQNMADMAAKGRANQGAVHHWYRDGSSVERGRRARQAARGAA